MNASFLVSPSVRGWFAASELAPHIETFVERLVRDGYSCRTTANHVDSIAHFARWMSRSRLKVERLDEAAIQRFLDRHLPRCDCPPPAHRNRGDLSAGCHLLLRVLWDQGVRGQFVLRLESACETDRDNALPKYIGEEQHAEVFGMTHRRVAPAWCRQGNGAHDACCNSPRMRPTSA